ncbi:MAG: hypothetical protein JNM70_20390, partial [Anaerolineae bacterium]|nr:hypothetical protein [Anaerolineae bacterium]
MDNTLDERVKLPIRRRRAGWIRLPAGRIWISILAFVVTVALWQFIVMVAIYPTFIIPAPLEVDALMKRVRKGQLVTIDGLRTALAQKHGADFACPIT